MDVYEAYMEIREDALGLADPFPLWNDLSEDEQRKIRMAWTLIWDRALDDFCDKVEGIIG